MKKHLISYSAYFVFLLALSGGFAHASPKMNPKEIHLSENKALVRAFYDQAFNQHRLKEAAEKYLSDAYIQHNPHVASGKKAFIEAFEEWSKTDRSKTEFIRMIAEGDLVVLHSHKIPAPGGKERVGVDIFRIKDGKIDEHWDVNEDVPAKTVSGNTVY